MNDCRSIVVFLFVFFKLRQCKYSLRNCPSCSKLVNINTSPKCQNFICQFKKIMFKDWFTRLTRMVRIRTPMHFFNSIFDASDSPTILKQFYRKHKFCTLKFSTYLKALKLCLILFPAKNSIFKSHRTEKSHSCGRPCKCILSET